MGFLDDIGQKAGELADQHADTIADGIDKAADLIDERTGGAHTEHIETGAAKAKELVVEQLGDDQV